MAVVAEVEEKPATAAVVVAEGHATGVAEAATMVVRAGATAATAWAAIPAMVAMVLATILAMAVAELATTRTVLQVAKRPPAKTGGLFVYKNKLISAAP